MYKDDVEKIPECCYKCKYFLSGETQKVAWIKDEFINKNIAERGFTNLDELKRNYPEVTKEHYIIREMFIDKNYSNGSVCRKSPPRMPGNFPKIDPQAWCGSFKQKESENV